MGSEMRLQSRFWFTWAVAYVTYIFCALIWVDRSYLWDVIFVRSTYMPFKATFGLTDFVANCTSQVIRAGWNCSVRKRNFGSRVWFDMANVTCLRKQDTITMLTWPSLNRWRKVSHISFPYRTFQLSMLNSTLLKQLASTFNRLSPVESVGCKCLPFEGIYNAVILIFLQVVLESEFVPTTKWLRLRQVVKGSSYLKC